MSIINGKPYYAKGYEGQAVNT